MHVALTADPYLPVPPRLYGGIERVVDALVRGLTRRGHRVTLLAHPDSEAPADRLFGYGRPPHFTPTARAGEIADVARFLWEGSRSFDVVHSFGRLAALLPVLPLRTLPKVQTYQRDRIPWRSVRWATRLAGASILFTGCSSSVYRGPAGGAPPAGRWRTVFNCVDPARYAFVGTVPADAPLAFLGRLEPVKGVHHAVAIAARAGRRLVIAGNRVEAGSSAGYFAREIEPHLDGDRVRWIGPVDDAAKDRLLGSAAALLAPIEFDEPFGIVLAEAFACGTPVVAFRRGSVPEVVREGVNGFSCATVEEAVACVGRLPEIDRAAVRADLEARFSEDRVVEEYLGVYAGLEVAAGRSPARGGGAGC